MLMDLGKVHDDLSKEFVVVISLPISGRLLHSSSVGCTLGDGMPPQPREESRRIRSGRCT